MDGMPDGCCAVTIQIEQPVQHWQDRHEYARRETAEKKCASTRMLWREEAWFVTVFSIVISEYQDDQTPGLWLPLYGKLTTRACHDTSSSKIERRAGVKR